jgi:hypothetical protein
MAENGKLFSRGFTLPQQLWSTLHLASNTMGAFVGSQIIGQSILWAFMLGLGFLGVVSTVVSAQQLDAWQQISHSGAN